MENQKTLEQVIVEAHGTEDLSAIASAVREWMREQNDAAQNALKTQRWLKPSEVTEPGVYWIADTRGGLAWKRLAPEKIYAMNIVQSLDGLREWNTMFCRPLSQWDKNILLLGPIQPPEYTKEHKSNARKNAQNQKRDG